MIWNFLAGDYLLRLPVADSDRTILQELLQVPAASAHIPRLPFYFDGQLDEEFRQIVQRFEAREAAYWMVENAEDKLVARISIQHISWLQRSAQLQWELSDLIDLEGLQQILPALKKFCFEELGLHRLEMRLRPDFERHNQLLTALGFEYEGCLPEQLEFQDESVDLAVWSILAD